jgi:hypothetical protein
MAFPINPLPTFALETPYPLPAETTKRPHDHHDNNSDDDKDDGVSTHKLITCIRWEGGGTQCSSGNSDGLSIIIIIK